MQSSNIITIFLFISVFCGGEEILVSPPPDTLEPSTAVYEADGKIGEYLDFYKEMYRGSLDSFDQQEFLHGIVLGVISPETPVFNELNSKSFDSGLLIGKMHILNYSGQYDILESLGFERREVKGRIFATTSEVMFINSQKKIISNQLSFNSGTLDGELVNGFYNADVVCYSSPKYTHHMIGEVSHLFIISLDLERIEPPYDLEQLIDLK